MTPHGNNPDALPQLIGDFLPVDEWQLHINDLFYGLRGGRFRDFYQTFAAADYRLAHALAADYSEGVRKRDRAKSQRDPLTIMEWGCGNGNLAACFLTHLQALDTDGEVYPRVRYILVDKQQAVLSGALAHPDLAGHKDRVEGLCADVANLSSIADQSVDRIICNELWNDLPTKLMVKKGAEIEEEFMRPNLSEALHLEIDDWSGFVHAFMDKDIDTLKTFPAFLEGLIWEKEYRKVDWKAVPFRKTITDFLKKIDEHVLVPVNVGAALAVKEAKRVLAPDAIGLSSYDAGTGDLKVLNDLDKPCYGQFGGQYSFMVNFALLEAVARHVGLATSTLEAQKEFVGRSLNTNVMSLMDLLATHPRSSELKGWEQDRLILQTIRALNDTYESPYRRTIDFPLSNETSAEARDALQGLFQSLKPQGVPDTIAYLSEEEILAALPHLEPIGYDQDMVTSALLAPPQGVDYYHQLLRPE